MAQADATVIIHRRAATPDPDLIRLADLVHNSISFAYGVHSAIIGVEHEHGVGGGLNTLMGVHIERLHEIEEALKKVHAGHPPRRGA